MYSKIQGGGSGTYANSGSAGRAADYLERESKQAAMRDLNAPEAPFFNHRAEGIAKEQVIRDLDQNKRKLRKSDAKFFVITINPSAKEIRVMGGTDGAQRAAFKQFIKEEVMEQYAANFKKGLSRDDLKYYAVIHEKRGGKSGEQLHAHILVSRRTEGNSQSISPQTNHSNTKEGVVKGGFSRTGYYKGVEQCFDQKFSYTRDLSERFEYQNARKKANYREMERLLEGQAEKKGVKKQVNQWLRQAPEQQQQHKKGRGLSL